MKMRIFLCLVLVAVACSGCIYFDHFFLPDVRMTGFRYMITPQEFTPGKSLGEGILLEVHNRGSVFANSLKGYFIVGIFLSKDNLYDENDIPLIDSEITIATPMAPDELRKITVTNSVTIPPTVQPGVYLLMAFADIYNDVQEFKEEKHGKGCSITITVPANPNEEE